MKTDTSLTACPTEARPTEHPSIHKPDPDGGLAARYRDIRATTEALCSPLEIEDYIPQSMPDASPAKWHLAHTTWFFETFLLKPFRDGQGVTPREYAFLFNSYYNAMGERIARNARGLLTRPTVSEVYQYRSRVDEQVLEWLENADEATVSCVEPLLVLGLNHEQQHQELLLTDLKHLFAANPMRPAYRASVSEPAIEEVPPHQWLSYPGGIGEVGFAGPGFAFDNELPRHTTYVQPYKLANRLVTNAEFLAFLEDGGYDRPELWLSDGWNTRQAQGWTAPLYWEVREGQRSAFTLAGVRDLVLEEPVCHVSYYEADAYARWAGARLPTEVEWELAAVDGPILGNFLENGSFHPRPLSSEVRAHAQAPYQSFGDVWEWTRSPYTAYPGYRPAPGALGEYNGKFMCNQMVLRGGSCATPRSHVRPTYRNFFPPDARWQFSGVRVAQDG